MLLILRFGISLINLCLLGVFIFIFGKRHLQFRSTFTLGFLIFAIALFIRTFFASPIFNMLLGYEVEIGDYYRFIADIFELAALLIFLYVIER